MSPKATTIQRAFNSMGGALGVPKQIAPKDSWWTDPKLQIDREAFQKRLVDEEFRMLGGKFGSRGAKTHDKGLKEK